MKKNKNSIIIALVTIIMIIMIVAIGPCDIFTHGYFSEEIDCNQIAEEDYLDLVSLEHDYSMTFVPQKDHMTGMEIYLVNQPDGNTGILNMMITDLAGHILDNVIVDLAKVKSASWYKVYTDSRLKKGEEYTLNFSLGGSITSIPCLQKVDSDYLPEETLSGNILLCYAYSEPTFSFHNKVLITIFIVAIWMIIVSHFVESRYILTVRHSAFVLLSIATLSWNYMYNSMDNHNSSFSSFQADSETLVTGVIYAEEDGEYFRSDSEYGFGLGRYFDLKGKLNGYGLTFTTDTNLLNGYSRNDGSLVVNSNPYSKDVAVAGNQILFKNGDIFQISSIEDNGSSIIIHLNTDRPLSPAKYGPLDDVTFLGAGGNPLHNSLITAYTSQYGLQGKVFRHIARHLNDEEELKTLNLLCAIITASVFVLIVVLIAIKYNALFAGCFFITFWLSPWIVNFSRNLYWVEFTWFIPMAIGLICSIKINDIKWRIAGYISTFVAITGKCLCGYEYITAIMMGLISFMLVDFMLAFSNKEKEKAILLLRTIIIIGVVSLLGFVTAICIHAPLKGNGSIIEGLKSIFEQDVLRRTIGADLNDFDAVYWSSFNASVWEVYCKYFHFNTAVITGIAGNLFPLVCVTPLAVFAYEFKHKELNVEQVALYLVFFFTSISWFILAKSHSYIHTPLNYVLWYFGFVQTCFYVVINKFICFFRNCKHDVRD